MVHRAILWRSFIFDMCGGYMFWCCGEDGLDMLCMGDVGWVVV